jgi:hypothetical protein
MDTRVDYGVDIKWEIDSIREVRGERCDDEVVRKVVLSRNCSHTSDKRGTCEYISTTNSYDTQFHILVLTSGDPSMRAFNRVNQFRLSSIPPWLSLDSSYPKLEYDWLQVLRSYSFVVCHLVIFS